jgi:uncharacterized protein (UPF0210 family)
VKDLVDAIMVNIIKPTIRTITAFVHLQPSDFDVTWGSLFSSDVGSKVSKCVTVLRAMEKDLQKAGYTVQTVRIATNPFGEWLLDEGATNEDRSKKSKQEKLSRLERLDQLMGQHKIEFCSVGPAKNRHEARLCPDIVAQSRRFSCSKIVDAGDVESANIAAETILAISKLGENPDAPKHIKGGLGNFRFCAASSCKPYIPFFPAAKADSKVSEDVYFALGLENGPVAQALLKETKSISKIGSYFGKEMADILKPLQEMGEKVDKDFEAKFLGIDTSLNPSLDEDGSVAAAIEELAEVKVFGGPGTLGAAAEITKALQSLADIKLTGYCGLMLPVCEDTRLAQLANDDAGRQLRVSDLLSISSVCGVGVDTVPVPGDCSKEDLSSLILDVAGIAGRWDKSLSCRVFPVPGKKAGDMTDFDSPYLVNSRIFSLE